MSSPNSKSTFGDGIFRVIGPLLGLMSLCVAAILLVVACSNLSRRASASMFLMAWLCLGNAGLWLFAVPRLWTLWKDRAFSIRRIGALAGICSLAALGAVQSVDRYGWQIIPSSPLLSGALWLSWIAGCCVAPLLLPVVARPPVQSADNLKPTA